MSEEKISSLRSITEKPAWLARSRNLTYKLSGSIALQKNQDKPRPSASILSFTKKAFKNATKTNNFLFIYKKQDKNSIQLWLNAENFFQNILNKHSKIEPFIYLANISENVSMVHWHSSCAPRRVD